MKKFLRFTIGDWMLLVAYVGLAVQCRKAIVVGLLCLLEISGVISHDFYKNHFSFLEDEL